TEGAVMAAPYGFGFCQEDDRVDAEVLRPAPGRRLLCVASGGEGALGMVVRGARVQAVDIDPAQLHLCELKRAAALTLPSADAAGFLGYAVRDGRRRLEDYARVRAELPDEARTWWDPLSAELAQGALWCGRYERFIRPFLRVLRRLWGRRNVDALCASADRGEQERCFDRYVGRPWVRATFRAAFHPAVYGGRGLAKEALSGRTDPTPLGEQFYGWFRSFCTATPGTENWFLQVVMRGGLLDPERGPDFLRPDGIRALRDGPGAVTWSLGDLRTVLAAEGGRYDAATVSNLGDWLGPERFGELLRELCTHLEPDAPLLWREMQAVQEPPGDLPLSVDRARGEVLRRTDRHPFYRLVPAVVGG
ncbi:MAG: DUF3419 family protein, partial [Myxococcales bacterium]|nr:DUF3419 family protein [Myxococcales bacterium]